MEEEEGMEEERQWFYDYEGWLLRRGSGWSVSVFLNEVGGCPLFVSVLAGVDGGGFTVK